MRREYTLDQAERARFNRLQPFPGEALAFWKKIADRRGLDWRSLIANDKTFSALPQGHKYHWCYPQSLQCKKRFVLPER